MRGIRDSRIVLNTTCGEVNTKANADLVAPVILSKGDWKGFDG